MTSCHFGSTGVPLSCAQSVPLSLCSAEGVQVKVSTVNLVASRAISITLRKFWQRLVVHFLGLCRSVPLLGSDGMSSAGGRRNKGANEAQYRVHVSPESCWVHI